MMGLPGVEWMVKGFGERVHCGWRFGGVSWLLTPSLFLDGLKRVFFLDA